MTPQKGKSQLVIHVRMQIIAKQISQQPIVKKR